MNDFQKRPEFIMGRAAEEVVAAWYLSSGWGVHDTSACDGPGFAPRIAFADYKLVLPDLLVFKGGDSRFVEVKAKDSASFTRMTNRLEHGFENYGHYLRVQEVTGIKVQICIYEHTTDTMLCAWLGDLMSPRVSSIDASRPAYFFARSLFEEYPDFLKSMKAAGYAS